MRHPRHQAERLSGGQAWRDEIAKFWADHKQTGTLDFENWPLYIDVGAKNSDHPTLDMFTKQTGIKVKYTEGIQQVGHVLRQDRAGARVG